MKPAFIMKVYFSLIAMTACLPVSCGGNLGDCSGSPRILPCKPKTPEETARRAMKNHDFDAAVAALVPETEALVADESLSEAQRYRLHPLLSAAYSGRSGFSILTAVQSPSSGTGGGLIDQMSSFVPSPQGIEPATYSLRIEDMRLATVTLQHIPATLLVALKDDSYGKSAALQLTLYQAAYSIMLMNQFILSPSTGGFDPSRLSSMTDADAEAILNALSGAGQVPGAQSPELQAKIDSALATIDASPGESRRDKLADYLAKNGGGASP